ncbi:MAG: phosphatase PAP2 family protein [Burkholderiales bacterium]|nr:phosphatase PAP2 family protein [Burkholderiales bacterium]
MSGLASLPTIDWHLFTRVGEAQILLPAAVLALLALARSAAGRRLARSWLAALALAVLLTTASKVAFIGWGVGSAVLDFTGISGHAMFAAAVYPLLGATLVPGERPGWVRAAVVAGALLALLVGVSRVITQAHSVSEVIAGLVVGGAVGVLALGHARSPRGHFGLWAPTLVALWLVATPRLAPPSQTHAIVTRLALAISGHERPYTRAELHARERLNRV